LPVLTIPGHTDRRGEYSTGYRAPASQSEQRRARPAGRGWELWASHACAVVRPGPRLGACHGDLSLGHAEKLQEHRDCELAGFRLLDTALEAGRAWPLRALPW